MHKLKFYILLLLFPFYGTLLSQVNLFEFGKVSIDELKTTNHPNEPAVILAKVSNLQLQEVDGFMASHRNYVRIKLQDSSAFDRGHFIFDYYHKDGYERIRNIRGIITYPNGVQYQLKNNDINRDKIDREWTRISFSFPNIAEGSIIEYSYTISVNDVFPLEDFVFQYDIPVEYAEFTFDIDNAVKYDFEITNEAMLTPIRSGFVAKHIPPLKPDALIDNIDNYAGKIITHINKVNYDYDAISLSTEWDEHAKNLLSFEYFGAQLTEHKYADRVLSNFKEIIKADLPNKEKIIRFNKELTEKVKWNNVYDVYTNSSLDEAYLNESANSAELNLMMANLLKACDITFVPVLVKLRNEGKISTKSKDLDQFSHVILLTEIDGETLFIDVQDAYKSPFIIREDVLNKIGLAVMAEPVWIKLEPINSSQTHIAEFILDQRGISGNISSRFEGYSAHYERLNFANDTLGQFWENRLRQKHPRTYVSELDAKNVNKTEESFQSTIKVEIADAYEIFKDTIYLDPVLWSNFPANPFMESERFYPIDIAYPYSEQYLFNLNIPEGYSVVSLPESIQMTTPKENLEFRFSCDVVNGKIQVHRSIIFKDVVYPGTEFESIYQIFEKLDSKSKEKIILVRNREKF